MLTAESLGYQKFPPNLSRPGTGKNRTVPRPDRHAAWPEKAYRKSLKSPTLRPPRGQGRGPPQEAKPRPCPQRKPEAAAGPASPAAPNSVVPEARRTGEKMAEEE